MPSRNVVFWYVGTFTYCCVTGSGPCHVAPPSVDQISEMFAREKSCCCGLFVVVVQTVPSGATCGSRYESQRLPETVGRICGVDQSVCEPSGRASACDSKMTEGFSTKIVHIA